MRACEAQRNAMYIFRYHSCNALPQMTDSSTRMSSEEIILLATTQPIIAGMTGSPTVKESAAQYSVNVV